MIKDKGLRILALVMVGLLIFIIGIWVGDTVGGSRGYEKGYEDGSVEFFDMQAESIILVRATGELWSACDNNVYCLEGMRAAYNSNDTVFVETIEDYFGIIERMEEKNYE